VLTLTPPVIWSCVKDVNGDGERPCCRESPAATKVSQKRKKKQSYQLSSPHSGEPYKEKSPVAKDMNSFHCDSGGTPLSQLPMAAFLTWAMWPGQALSTDITVAYSQDSVFIGSSFHSPGVCHLIQ
jgi:hypothetical protein